MIVIKWCSGGWLVLKEAHDLAERRSSSVGASQRVDGSSDLTSVVFSVLSPELV